MSKVYGFSVGDYARVTATNHEKNEITVQSADGREVTYNPARLSAGGFVSFDDLVSSGQYS